MTDGVGETTSSQPQRQARDCLVKNLERRNISRIRQETSSLCPTHQWTRCFSVSYKHQPWPNLCASNFGTTGWWNIGSFRALTMLVVLVVIQEGKAKVTSFWRRVSLVQVLILWRLLLLLRNLEQCGACVSCFLLVTIWEVVGCQQSMTNKKIKNEEETFSDGVAMTTFVVALVLGHSSRFNF